VITAVEVWSAMVIHTDSEIDCFVRKKARLSKKCLVNLFVVAVARLCFMPQVSL
jgi:hypothetical protein